TRRNHDMIRMNQSFLKSQTEKQEQDILNIEKEISVLGGESDLVSTINQFEQVLQKLTTLSSTIDPESFQKDLMLLKKQFNSYEESSFVINDNHLLRQVDLDLIQVSDKNLLKLTQF